MSRGHPDDEGNRFLSCLQILALAFGVVRGDSSVCLRVCVPACASSWETHNLWFRSILFGISKESSTRTSTSTVSTLKDLATAAIKTACRLFKMYTLLLIVQNMISMRT